MIKPWYDDGYLVAYPAVLAWALLLAALFHFRPSWADRLYRGLGFRITPQRGRVLAIAALAYTVIDAVAWALYVRSN